MKLKWKSEEEEEEVVSDSSSQPVNSFGQREYDQLPLRVYVMGAMMILLGLVTFVLMSTSEGENSYLYLFLYLIPSNTAISLFPHEPVLIYYGQFASIWISALVATGGTVVAGFLDHLVFVPVLNYVKITSYKESQFYKRATRIFMRYPFATILVTGMAPIPFFPFKFLCFSINYPMPRYLTALAMARFPRYALLAWLGSKFGIPGWILIASVVVIFGLYAIRGGPEVFRRLRARRKASRSERDPVEVTTETANER